VFAASNHAVLNVSLSSPPTSDALVADILWTTAGASAQVAEIACLNGELIVTLFQNPSGREWTFPVAEFVDAIDAAAALLLDRLT
jgi:hypothetical protein